MAPARLGVRNRTLSLALVATLMAATLLSTLTGCTSSSSGATLYESIDDLARDSSAIVIGTVTTQRQDGETMISTFEVSNAPTNPQLGADLESSSSTLDAGDTVEVRQTESSGSAALLEGGREYLLFLTPSMLTGDAATQFYVTGAGAGLYFRDGDEFRRLLTDTDDTLPATITTSGDEGSQ